MMYMSLPCNLHRWAKKLVRGGPRKKMPVGRGWKLFVGKMFDSANSGSKMEEPLDTLNEGLFSSSEPCSHVLFHCSMWQSNGNWFLMALSGNMYYHKKMHVSFTEE